MQMERRKFLESACKACLLVGAGLLIIRPDCLQSFIQVMKLADQGKHSEITRYCICKKIHTNRQTGRLVI